MLPSVGNHYDITIGIKELLNGSVVVLDYIYRLLLKYITGSAFW